MADMMVQVNNVHGIFFQIPRGMRHRPTVHYVGFPIINDVVKRRNMILKDIVRSMIFSTYIDIPIGVIGIDQGLISDFVQDTIDQDNVGEPFIQEVV